MREALCQFVVCPGCGGDLAVEAAETDGDEILSGDLVCAGCGRRVPVAGGVPRFLTGDLARDVEHTARNFGASWKIWRDIHDDRYRRQQIGRAHV